MPSLREVRECLLLAHAQNVLDDEEFVLLYDMNSSKNPDFPYWNYEKFNLEFMTDDECKAEFRFYKNDVYVLKEALQVPETTVCQNGLLVDGLEATCILLKRFAYPIRFGDMVSKFGRAASQLSMICAYMTNLVYDLHNHRLRDLQQPWLAPIHLEEFANAIHDAGSPLTNCWGFIDGTVRPICRPGELQRVVYNGHKRVHALKFQSIATPNGLVANLFGPVEGRRHDSGMLTDSMLYPQLQQFSHAPNGTNLCIYGDLAYPFRAYLQTPFRLVRLNGAQQAYNTAMSKVRIGVEWVFGDITNFFKFLDFKKNLKIGLSPIGKMYLVCALLMNCHTCMYGSMTSTYFQMEPPTLQEYLV